MTTWPRRLLRYFLRTLVFLLGSIFLAVATVLLVLHTDPGRELLRSQVEKRVQPLFRGCFELGRIEGSLFGRLAIGKSTLCDAAGRRAIQVERIEIAYRLLPLIQKRVEVERLALTRPDVLLVTSTAGVNLATLLVESEPKPEPPPDPTPSEPWTIQLAELTLQGGRAVQTDAAASSTLTVSGLELAAALGYRTALDVNLKNLSGHFDGIGFAFPFRAAGRIGLDALALSVPELSLAIFERKLLGLAGGRFGFEDGALRAELALTASTETVRGLLGSDFLPLSFALDGRISRASESAPFMLRLSGRALEAKLNLLARLGLEPLDGSLSLALFDFDPAVLGVVPFSGQLSARIGAHLTGDTIETMRAGITLRTTGALNSGGEELVLSPLTVTATVAERKLRAALDLDTTRGTAKASGELTLSPRLRIERSAVDVSLPSLSAWLPGIFSAGAFELHAKGSGPLDRLNVFGSASGKSLAASGARVGTLGLEFNLHRLTPFPGGHAELLLNRVAFAGERLTRLEAVIDSDATEQRANVRLTATGTTTLELVDARLEARLGEVIELWIPKLNGRARGIDFDLNTTLQYAPTGSLRIVSLQLDSTAGRIKAAGNLEPAAFFTRPLELELSADALDLPRLARAARSPFVPDEGALTLSLVASGARGPQTAKFRLLADGVRGPKMDVPVRIKSEAQLADGVLNASVSVDGRALGLIEIEAEIERPLDFEHLDERNVRRLTLVAPELSATEIGKLISLPLNGALAARLSLDRGGEKIDGTIGIGKLEIRGIDGPITGRFSIGSEGETKHVHGTIALAGRPLVSLSARAEAKGPRPLLALADADVQAKLQLADFRIAYLSPLLGLDTLDGDVRLDLDVTRKRDVVSAVVETHLTNFAIRPDEPPVGLDLTGRLGDGHLSFETTLGALDVGSMHLELESKAPIDVLAPGAWQNALDPSAIERFELELERFDLEALRNRIGLAMRVGGLLQGTIAYLPAEQRLEGQISMRRLRLDPETPKVDGELFIKVSDKNAELQLGLLGAPEGPLRTPQLLLSLDGKAGVGLTSLLRGDLGPAPLDVKLNSPRLPLPWLGELLGLNAEFAGALSLTASVAGTLSDPRFALAVSGDRPQVDDLVFDKFDVKASRVGQRVRARMDLRQEKGFLELNADLAGFSSAAPVQIGIKAEHFRLSFIGAFLDGSGILGGLAGRLAGDAKITGTMGDPRAAGQLVFAPLKIVFAPPVPTLEHTRAALDLKGRTVAVDVKGRSGRGSFEVQGNIDLEALAQPSFDFKARTDELPFAAGPKELWVNSEVSVKGAMKDRLDLAVTIDDALIKIPNTGPRNIRLVREFPDLIYVDDPAARRKKFELNLPEEKAALAIKIRSAKPIPVRGDEVNAAAQISLDIGGELGANQMSGRAEVGQGYLNVFGKRWDIMRAEIEFFPNSEPRLNIQLAHDFPTLVVYIKVTGSVTDPDLELNSDPGGYDEAALLGFVIGSGPGDDTSRPLESQAAGAAASALIGTIQSKVKDRIPLDTLQLELGDEQRGARVTVGKWITDSLFLGYDYQFDPDPDQNENEGFLQFRLGRGWLLEGRYGDENIGGLDALWVKRF